MIRRSMAVCLILSIAACAGREAVPVATSNAQDETMSCLEIDREIGRNNASMRALAGENHGRTGRNVLAGAVGLVLFWPALFALDLRDGAGKEMVALDSRNDMLEMLARQNTCTVQAALRSETAKTEYAENLDEDGNPIKPLDPVQAAQSPGTPVAMTPGTHPVPASAKPAADAQGGDGLKWLMDSFLAGDIDQTEYEQRRVALGL
tara:strand:+ start:505 stop:1122 length:618 start_codon:yes stop_codon:yes gene_type:complete